MEFGELIDEYYYNAIDLLCRMIATPSFSREEDTVAQMIVDELGKENYDIKRIGNNVVAFSPNFDERKPTLLLNSHIDTVKPVSGWSKNPFEPEICENKLYGLGSNDAGASVVTLLQTFFYLSKKPQNYNIIFLASCQEEVSGKEGAELALTFLPKITMGIVGEPTGMNPAVAEKGLMVLDCLAQGKAGHAARNEGDNAIYNAMNDIEWFRNFKFPKTSDLLDAVKMSVTMIEAGTQHNVVPDICKFVVDVRSNEMYSNEELFEIIDANTKSIITPRSFRLNSSCIDINHNLVKRLKMIGKTPYGSPTLSDQTFMRFPTLKLGPGESSRSHTADEFIYLSEIREAFELYTKILDGLSI